MKLVLQYFHAWNIAVLQPAVADTPDGPVPGVAGDNSVEKSTLGGPLPPHLAIKSESGKILNICNLRIFSLLVFFHKIKFHKITKNYCIFEAEL